MNDGLFCDGGVIGRNPSKLGGTWAWCLVKGGKIIKSDSGVVHAIDKTTNNYTELHAVIAGLQNMEPGWDGIIFTDSLITLRRIRNGAGFKGIPTWLKKAAIELRTGRKWRSVLVAGHPTKVDLMRGYKTKGRQRYPVSLWNVWCDKECKRLAKEFMEKRK